jgi:hypothetical protein
MPGKWLAAPDIIRPTMDISDELYVIVRLNAANGAVGRHI